MVKIINVWHVNLVVFNRSYFKRDYGIILVYKSSAKVDWKMFLASYKYFVRVRESTARRFPRPAPSPPVATPSIDYRYKLWSRDKYRTKRMYREFTRVLYIYRQPGSVHTVLVVRSACEWRNRAANPPCDYFKLSCAFRRLREPSFIRGFIGFFSVKSDFTSSCKS